MWTERLPRARAAALALAACFAFTGLGNHPLRASDEPRVAGIAWTMQHEGQWLVPWLADQPFLEHPPLFYALLGGFLKALGATETVARLPSALASFLTLWLCFELGRRLAGARGGVAALLVLVGMRGFFRYSHKVLVDPLLALCVLAGYAAYLHAAWSDAPQRSGGPSGRSAPVPWLAVLGIYAAAALAFAVKGLVGVVLLGGPIAIDVLCFRGLRFTKSWAHPAGAVLLAGACLGYPAWLYREIGPAALHEFAVSNSLLRIFPTEGLAGVPYRGGHVNPFWYYLPRIFEQLGWTVVLVPGAVAWLWRSARAEGSSPGLRFLALVFPIGVLLLSIPGTKRGLYMLPLLPPLAVALGAWIASLRREDPRRSRIEARIAAAQAPLLLVWISFAVSVGWNVLVYPHGGHSRDLGPVAREVVALTGPGPVTGYLLPEDIRGAIPFYTGRSIHSLRSEAEVARFVAERPDGFLLVGKKAPDDLGGGALARVRTWKKAEGANYILLRVAGSPSGRAPEYSEKANSPSASSNEGGGSRADQRA
jgi:4-amino-4-deoxy-L-arabinose transferase-like glycosyltransferase